MGGIGRRKHRIVSVNDARIKPTIETVAIPRIIFAVIECGTDEFGNLHWV